jgi:hypothetical protein
MHFSVGVGSAVSGLGHPSSLLQIWRVSAHNRPEVLESKLTP